MRNLTLLIYLTLLGKTSANTTNGNGNIPIDAMNITNDKLVTGTQLNILKSKCCLSKNEYVPITAKPKDVADADTVKRTFLPTLSTSIVAKYVPNI